MDNSARIGMLTHDLQVLSPPKFGGLLLFRNSDFIKACKRIDYKLKFIRYLP